MRFYSDIVSIDYTVGHLGTYRISIQSGFIKLRQPVVRLFTCA